ncbi:rhodanese-like domain-containing protein [Candidatus Vallotia tarda]|uniref:Rhodanese-like domain-containing protein n=1 Tax=Candidatus Vallotiella hemipterorum TaxID=1177213 RepID=A0A916JT38_9BURK|nr:rhodanese-like domain-containing protein [Candidatus Vallotia tarda]CAG7596319.1 Rhodanese-like domain-containing protein [Candidatus Vallotia tarda]
MKFFTEPANIILIATVLISGVLLVWPVWLSLNETNVYTPQEAIQLINRRNAVILDLRYDDEFMRGHLPQARHLLFNELNSKVSQAVKNKKIPVLLVCQNGRYSARARNMLKKAGYLEVFTLQGGIEAWQRSDLPVVK